MAHSRGTSRWWIPLLGVLALGGLAMVLFGGGGDTADDAAGDTDGSASGSATLDLSDTDADAVSELAGLGLPESTSDFLTARLDDDSQLDVTFTIDPAEEAEFVEGSGLPQPVEGERVILHSSPLWELNTEGTVRGSADRPDPGGGSTDQPRVRRAVELVEEGDLVRVRLVVTPARE
jgi:hypothetical protein